MTAPMTMTPAIATAKTGTAEQRQRQRPGRPRAARSARTARRARWPRAPRSAASAADAGRRPQPVAARSTQVAAAGEDGRARGSRTARARRARVCAGSVRATTTSATTVSGMLIAKIQRQEPASASAPPSSGPATAAVAQTAPDEALVAAALAGRDQVADRRVGERQEPAAAEALESARRDQLGHRLRAIAQSTEPARKTAIATSDQPPAAVEVGHLAVDRHGDGRARAGTP